MNTTFTQQPEAFRMFLGEDGFFRPQYRHAGSKWTNFVKDSKFVMSKDLDAMEKHLQQYTHTWTYESEGE